MNDYLFVDSKGILTSLEVMEEKLNSLFGKDDNFSVAMNQETWNSLAKEKRIENKDGDPRLIEIAGKKRTVVVSDAVLSGKVYIVPAPDSTATKSGNGSGSA